MLLSSERPGSLGMICWVMLGLRELGIEALPLASGNWTYRNTGCRVRVRLGPVVDAACTEGWATVGDLSRMPGDLADAEVEAEIRAGAVCGGEDGFSVDYRLGGAWLCGRWATLASLDVSCLDGADCMSVEEAAARAFVRSCFPV
ncbi:MAG: hypothetical protein LBR80_01710 [Deltaproteobacteria bacterium]|jgi:hypothetical protein|nr:hypothetical protein [Deltaproteobacteria bacterium]